MGIEEMDFMDMNMEKKSAWEELMGNNLPEPRRHNRRRYHSIRNWVMWHLSLEEGRLIQTVYEMKWQMFSFMN